MTDSERERGNRVDELLDALETMPEAEHDVYLARVCPDPELRREVLALRTVEPAAGAYLDRFVEELAPRYAEPPDLSGRRVGAYRLLQPLGQGGMGAVYEAERVDGAFAQRVALKLLTTALAGTEARERFLAERQILAGLEHPAIAHIVDGGVTEDGTPWFAMERVEGEPIDVYCDRHRLGVRQRLELFLQVCDAVEHAHRRLVVHRDLKPANVLVSGDGRVKLLDFGIAKLLADDDRPRLAPPTRVAHRLMTPEYASPEQVRGEPVTTASDVYQLGLLLYELLTGQRAYVAARRGRDALERTIVEQPPTRPSMAILRQDSSSDRALEETCRARGASPVRLRRQLRGDLDNIVLMALRKEAERRYGSADRLARDIRRHLYGLPVTARPDTWSYRSRKFLTRHALGASATAAGLVLAAGLTAFHTVRIQGERDQARTERRRAQAEAAKAEQVSRFLTGLFESVDPREALGTELTARELLDRGVREVDHELAGQPEVQAQMLLVLGRTYLELGVHDAAEKLIRRSLELQRDRLPAGHPEIARARTYLGFLRYRQGEYEQARELLQSAIRNLEAAPGEDALRLVDALHSLSTVYRRLHRYEESRASIERALRLQEELSGSDSVPAAQLRHSLASLQSETGELDRAERLYRRVATIYERELRPGDPRMGYVLSDLATIRLKRGRLEGLEPMYRRSLAILEGAYGPDSDRLAIALNALGNLLIAGGRNDEAVDVLRRALAVQGTGEETDHPQAAYPLSSLGDAYREQGRLREARDSYRRAVTILERAQENDAFDPMLASCLVNLGFVEKALGDQSATEQLLRRALAIWRHAPDDVDPQFMPVLLDLGRWLAERGRCAEAVPLLQRAASIQGTIQRATSSQVTELENLLTGCSRAPSPPATTDRPP